MDSIELGLRPRTSRRKVKAIGGFRVERPKNPPASRGGWGVEVSCSSRRRPSRA